mmetsp:Transcript_10703/g.40042  ORF Transcript_10703/g.40042 Transcript_10703/m.40042 type:complete len:252 (+) Transcript_10703:4258-5013(+)
MNWSSPATNEILPDGTALVHKSILNSNHGLLIVVLSFLLINVFDGEFNLLVGQFEFLTLERFRWCELLEAIDEISVSNESLERLGEKGFEIETITTLILSLLLDEILELAISVHFRVNHGSGAVNVLDKIRILFQKLTVGDKNVQNLCLVLLCLLEILEKSVCYGNNHLQVIEDASVFLRVELCFQRNGIQLLEHGEVFHILDFTREKLLNDSFSVPDLGQMLLNALFCLPVSVAMPNLLRSLSSLILRKY